MQLSCAWVVNYTNAEHAKITTKINILKFCTISPYWFWECPPSSSSSLWWRLDQLSINTWTLSIWTFACKIHPLVHLHGPFSIVWALETHPNTVQGQLKLVFIWSRAFKCSIKTFATRLSSRCYYNTISIHGGSHLITMNQRLYFEMSRSLDLLLKPSLWSGLVTTFSRLHYYPFNHYKETLSKLTKHVRMKTW